MSPKQASSRSGLVIVLPGKRLSRLGGSSSRHSSYSARAPCWPLSRTSGGPPAGVLQWQVGVRIGHSKRRRPVQDQMHPGSDLIAQLGENLTHRRRHPDWCEPSASPADERGSLAPTSRFSRLYVAAGGFPSAWATSLAITARLSHATHFSTRQRALHRLERPPGKPPVRCHHAANDPNSRLTTFGSS